MTNRKSSQAPAGNSSANAAVLLREYEDAVAATDRFPPDQFRPILLGLYGEVGGIMAAAKKLHREKEVYAGYRSAVEEEFGDALWYLTALCRRLKLSMEQVLSDAIRSEGYSAIVAAGDRPEAPISHLTLIGNLSPLEETLLDLGEAAAALLRIDKPTNENSNLLRTFANQYLRALAAAGVIFSVVVEANKRKVAGRFLHPDATSLPTFDADFAEEERLPRCFEIWITQRKSGQSYLRWNGVFIGDPLTDNILDPDGYRFHDVLHLAHAAVLHWSPTFRALIRHKRKSDPTIDEAQDGGRAIVVEEGLTAWIFSRAKNLNFFEGQNSVSFDLLKSVQQFVRGYEVEACPLKLWEHAILQGYEVFRKVRDHNGGVVVGNRDDRSIRYKPLEKS